MTAIIFSNNSPENIDRFLQSAIDKKVGQMEFCVLYTSIESTDADYLKVIEKHSIAIFKKVDKFKDDLLSIMNSSTSELIAFFKDTNYFFSEMPTADINSLMSDQDTFCFSLALGRNIKYSYANESNNVLLNEEENGDNTIKWNWVKHYLDFGRPLELGAGHIFHRKEVLKFFKKWTYTSIVGLEESFDNLDYYPKEIMSSYKSSVLADLIDKTENHKESLKAFDFTKIDRITIEL